MIQIQKSDSDLPEDFIRYVESKTCREEDFINKRNQSTDGIAIFRKFRKKPEYVFLKSKLAKDQGFICCYCNARISEKGATIEHIVPLSKDYKKVLEYSNLLIACNGGREDKFKSQSSIYPIYCDAHRGNKTLPFTPLDSKCWFAFDYALEDGSMNGNDDEASEVIRILNLDCGVLRQNRLDALEMLYDDEHNLLSNVELEKMRDSLSAKDDLGRFIPYFYIITCCINKII